MITHWSWKASQGPSGLTSGLGGMLSGAGLAPSAETLCPSQSPARGEKSPHWQTVTGDSGLSQARLGWNSMVAPWVQTDSPGLPWLLPQEEGRRRLRICPARPPSREQPARQRSGSRGRCETTQPSLGSRSQALETSGSSL